MSEHNPYSIYQSEMDPGTYIAATREWEQAAEARAGQQRSTGPSAIENLLVESRGMASWITGIAVLVALYAAGSWLTNALLTMLPFFQLCLGIGALGVVGGSATFGSMLKTGSYSRSFCLLVGALVCAGTVLASFIALNHFEHVAIETGTLIGMFVGSVIVAALSRAVAVITLVVFAIGFGVGFVALTWSVADTVLSAVSLPPDLFGWDTSVSFWRNVLYVVAFLVGIAVLVLGQALLRRLFRVLLRPGVLAVAGAAGVVILAWVGAPQILTLASHP